MQYKNIYGGALIIFNIMVCGAQTTGFSVLPFLEAAWWTG